MELQEQIKSWMASYVWMVHSVIPGPLTITYIIPIFLLIIALMIHPSTMSQTQLIWFFLIPIYACYLHAWSVMRSPDVVSVDIVLWATFLLAVDDPRVYFKRVRYLTSRDRPILHETPHEQDTSGANGVAKVSGHAVNGNSQKVAHVNANGTSRKTGAEHHELRIRYAPEPIIFEDEPYPDELWPRLRWVLNLAASDRLIRWKTGSKRHDAKQTQQPMTRLEYLSSVSQSLWLAALVIPVVHQISIHDPYFRNAATIKVGSPYSPTTSNTPATIAFLQYLLPPLVLRPLTLGFYSWAILSYEFNLIPLFPIALNYLTGSRFPNDNWSPHTTPPYFGAFSSIADGGLKAAWGTWWHQHMRYMVTSPGKALAKLLGLPKGSSSYSALVLGGAFLFSGVVHMGLVPPEPAYAIGGTSPNVLRLLTAAFFWVQPVGVAIEMAFEQAVGLLQKRIVSKEKGHLRLEDTVKGTSLEGLSKAIVRTFRFVWVLTWLCFTVQIVAIPYAELGTWNLPTLWLVPQPFNYYFSGKWIP